MQDRLPFCASGTHAAFVVGVEAYPQPLDLPTCANDADDMASFLLEAGYAVRRVVNPKFCQLWRAFDKFVEELPACVTTVLLYFSGHGVQLHSHTHILPSDALQLGRDHTFKFCNQAVDRLVSRTYSLSCLPTCRSRPWRG